jgi:GNAT superfamily N-acetyltransferase
MEIGTHPDYHRRGLASYLIKYGTDRADAAGLMCCLAASPMGALLYRKQGWIMVDKIELPLEDYGGEGVYVQGG